MVHVLSHGTCPVSWVQFASLLCIIYVTSPCWNRDRFGRKYCMEKS